MARIFAVPAILAVSLATADVSSLTLSSTDVASGGSVTGTVVVSSGTRSGSRVTLESSDPSVATVPGGLFVGITGRATFGVSSIKGAAGCTSISARTGTTPAKSQVLFVHPPSSSSSSMGLSLDPASTVGGSTVNGRVFVANPGRNLTVQLSSSDPSVVVPASVQLQVEEVGFAGSFTIRTAVVGRSTCSVITATHDSSQDRELLKVLSISG